MADRIPFLAISLILLHLFACSGAPANTFRSDTDDTIELIVGGTTEIVVDTTEPSGSTFEGVTIQSTDPEDTEDTESVAIEISQDQNVDTVINKVALEEVTSISSVAEDSTAVLADPVEILKDSPKESDDHVTTPTTKDNEDSSTESSTTDETDDRNLLKFENLNRNESNETTEASVIEVTLSGNVLEDEKPTESVVILKVPVENDASAGDTTEENTPEDARHTESTLVIQDPVQNEASGDDTMEENIPDDARITETVLILQDPVQNIASADATTEETIPEDARMTESVLILQDPVVNNPSADSATESNIQDDVKMTESVVILKDSVQNDAAEDVTTDRNDDVRNTESQMIFKNDVSADSIVENNIPEDARMTESFLAIKDSVQNDDATTDSNVMEIVRNTESTILKDSVQDNPSAEDTTEDNISEDVRRTESIMINDSPQNDATLALILDEVATESISTVVQEESLRTGGADPEDVTESLVKSTDLVSDSTDDVQADEIVKMEPQLVKIFDPSVDVEATTFLAEANLQTEPSATTESFLLADETDSKDGEELVTLVTTDDSITTQIGTEPGTESATESGTELISETTALPSVNRSLPSINTLPNLSKKRSYKGYKVYRVILPTEESVRRILSMEDEPGVEFWADPRLLLRPRGLFVTSAADVMVAPKIVPEMESVFRQARLTYTVLIDDVQNSIMKENPVGPSFARSQTNPSGQHRLTWQRYHRLSDINSYLDHLKGTYPDWIEVVPIGKSSQGRPIRVIKLSRSRQPAGVEPSQKKTILIDAGIHANEWITPAALTWMVNELVENADSYGCILDRFDFYFVPMVNPDGYEYSHAVDRMWRKTRRNYTSKLVRSSARRLRVDTDRPDDEQCLGADINRNFEFHWRKGGSSSNVCSPSFAGTKPFSEPESRALANFMLKQRSRLAMYISLHSYSQMWLLPWGFAETRPEDFSKLYSLAKIGARALQRVHNTSYLIGSVPDLLALASGTTQDWAKGVAGVHYSYTLEMRDAGERGIILPAQQIIPTAEETWAGIYAASVELAHRLYDHLPSCSPF